MDSIVTMRRFASFRDFLSRLIAVFRGPSIISTLVKTDALFREKILLTVTLVNNCYTCMNLHSAAGRRLGLDDAHIEDLLTLDREKFEYREWLALRYAQDRAFLGGAEPAGDYMEEYRRSYSPKERSRISKLVAVMLFANYWNNTFRRKAWREDIEGSSVSCRMKAAKRPDGGRA